MKLQKQVPSLRLTVLIPVILFFLAWLAVHIRELTEAQNGVIRFALGMSFAILIIIRRKPETSSAKPMPGAFISGAGIASVLLIIAGIVFNVRQCEWLGIVIILFVCLEWALPQKFSADIPPALLLLYWTYPLPNQIFGAIQLAMQKMSVNGSE